MRRQPAQTSQSIGVFWIKRWRVLLSQGSFKLIPEGQHDSRKNPEEDARKPRPELNVRITHCYAGKLATKAYE